MKTNFSTNDVSIEVRRKAVETVLAAWTKNKFCKKSYAVNKHGDSVEISDVDAVKFCALGALEKWVDDRTRQIIRSDYFMTYGYSLLDANDYQGWQTVVTDMKNLYKEGPSNGEQEASKA